MANSQPKINLETLIFNHAVLQKYFSNTLITNLGIDSAYG